ncbi:anthranilate synthase component I [Enterococcus nangangensis]|uniref:anthranilate synthase component I n=1 Tax=Enterococcus nangangensis TaxID=2559926 RepID=UPI0010F9FACA|nr:anthranilate synthase component I [Enterococcus nangangensis]
MRIVRELNGDCLTPVVAYLRLKGGQKSLLESIPREQEEGRYSIIAFDAVHYLSFKDGYFIMDERRYAVADPLKELEKYVLTTENLLTDLPFQGGAIGYASYDLASVYENLGTLPVDELDIPEMAFYLYESFVVYDHQKEKLLLVADNCYSHVATAVLKERIAKMTRELQTPSPLESKPVANIQLTFSSNTQQHEFETLVEKAKEKIIAGDLFQVVPSQRLKAAFPYDPFDYYRKLRLSNPSPYLYYLDLPAVKIIGSSPESLVRVKGKRVTTNPIAGTKKRGATKEEDEALAKSLLADEKERAEHQMLIDLGRNDLGKVSAVGSVEVPLYMTIERFRYVMHIVSLVTGTLKKEASAMDALKATLPAGTVSGAPKIRAMQRIYQWEKVRRNVYAGAVGYLSQNGNADFAIAIRTMMLKDATAYVQAGAGIVYDSDPTSEYFETLQKAKALLEVEG